MESLESLYKAKNTYFKEYPVVYIPGFINGDSSELALKYLRTLEYKPITHEDIIARYESELDVNEIPILKKMENILKKFGNKLSLPKKYKTEFFAFKYLKDHFVPEHTDNFRHKIIFMIHLGEFEGGRYVYKLEGKDVRIELKNGDAVLSINELWPGNWQNPVHSVEKIQSGVRYTIAGSLVSE